MSLPRGIWFEAAKNRYRVRKYRNRIPYLIGYFPTLAEAQAALSQLDEKLTGIPKRRRRHTHRPPPCASFSGVASSLRFDIELDPNLYRKTHR